MAASGAVNSPMKKQVGQGGQNIQVFVRVRPLNTAEKNSRSTAILDTPGTREVVVKEKATSSLTKTFNFDRVFGTKSAQQDVYKAVVGPLIKQVLQGYNCTVFAYGQTGTGKTYTMEGLGEIRGSWENDPNAGIIPRSMNGLFDGLRMSDATEWGVRVSFLELYNEEIFDLLSGNDDQSKLRLYEDGHKKGSVIIQGLEEVQVRDKREVFKILEKGSIKRQTAETKMNANSSRSHTVFTVTVFVNQQSIDGQDMLKIGKLNLVDLAGSENIGRSGAMDKRAREAGNINQSLLTLGRVITSLVDRAPHIPYRESKLTRLLQDSLGGRTKTSIIATVSPASINLEETLSTLDYAHRAKKITNRPELNQTISKKEKLLEYHKEIDQLKQELQAARDKDGVFLPHDTYNEQIKENARKEEEIKGLTKELKAKEQELEHFMTMFEDTKALLESTAEERDNTKRALDCTRTVLHKAESDKQEQMFLVKKHVETECKLSQQAQLLLEVSDQASSDLEVVHDKIDRQRTVDQTNYVETEAFTRNHADGQKRVESLVGMHVAAQSDFCSELRNRVDKDLEKKSEEKTAISSTYTDTVTQLVETMSTLERLLSDNMYKEQSWIEKLLKRMRNEADTQSSSFHTYLVDQLLSVANAILASVKNQGQTVDSLSSKIDKHVEQAGTKVEGYLDDQHKLSGQASEEEMTFLKDLADQNKKLSAQMTAEQEAAAEYRKKSQAFTKQMSELLEAQQKAEEKYIMSRNESLATSLATIAAVDESAAKAKVSKIERKVKMENLATGFKSDHAHHMNKITEEKTKAAEQLQTDQKVVSQGVDRIKTFAESFVNSGKDAWNAHYEKTETELRKKSDESSAHVKTAQGHTSDLRGKMLESQSRLDNLLEKQRAEDERESRNTQTELSSRCQETKDFGSAFGDQFRSLSHATHAFVTETLKKDIPSGRTPARSNRQYPRSLAQGTPDDLRLERYRAKRNAPPNTPAKFNLDEHLDDADSVISMSTQGGESLALGGSTSKLNSSEGNSSAFSSGSLSRQNSSEVLSTGKENSGDYNNVRFTRPRINGKKDGKGTAVASKIAKPRSRGGSRTRTKLAPVNN